MSEIGHLKIALTSNSLTRVDVAFALANPGYELGERIVAELQPLWPARCHSRKARGSRSCPEP